MKKILMIFFIILSVFFLVSCKKDDTKKEHEHIYSDWNTLTYATCEKEGLKERFCLICGEKEAIVLPKLDHTLELTTGFPPSIFDYGLITHKKCSSCGKLFLEDGTEVSVSDLQVPKLDAAFYLCVNDVKYEFKVIENEGSAFSLEISFLDLKENDKLKIIDKYDNEYRIFDEEGSLSKDGIILNDAKDSKVSGVLTPNGANIFITGLKYHGHVVVLERDDKTLYYPMTEAAYLDENKSSLIYGYLYLNKGDKLYIKDFDNDIIYDYDDVALRDRWKTFDFTKSDDNKIYIERISENGLRFGLELIEVDGVKCIYINKAFNPNSGTEFYLQNTDGVKYNFTKTVYDKNSNIYDSLLYYVKHDAVVNASDIIDFSEESGFIYYTASIKATSTMKMYLWEDGNGANHFLDSTQIESLDDEIVDYLTIDGNYFVLSSGDYFIGYTPNLDLIYVSKLGDVVVPIDEVNYSFACDGVIYNLNKENSFKITSIKIKAETLTYIVSGDEYYSDLVACEYASIYTLSGIDFIKFTEAGIYEISIDSETLKITIVKTGSIIAGDNYSYKLYSYPSNTREMTKKNEAEYELKGVELKKGDICCIMVQNLTTAESTSYFDLVNTDEAVASKIDGMDFFIINLGGTYTVTFNTLTSLITITPYTLEVKTYKLNYYARSGKLDTSKSLTLNNDLLELLDVKVLADEFFNVEDNLRNLFTSLEADNIHVELGNGTKINTLVFKDNGVYNIKFDTKNELLTVEFVRSLTDDEYNELTSLKDITSCNIMKSGEYDLIPFSLNSETGNYELLSFTLSVSGKVSFFDDDWVSIEFFLDDAVDSTVAIVSKGYLLVKKTGIYNIYINKESHIVNITLLEEIEEEFICYFYNDASFHQMTKNSDNEKLFEVKNIELKKDSYNPILDKFYEYLNITLDPKTAEGVALVSGASRRYLSVMADGTYDIYINIETLSVLVVKVK